MREGRVEGGGKLRKSPVLERVLYLDKKEKDSKKIKYNELSKMALRRDNYAKYVKEMYWPKVDEKKRIELQTILETKTPAAQYKVDVQKS